MKRLDPKLLGVLADLESALASATKLESRSLDLIRAAAEAVISEIYDNGSEAKLRSRTSSSKNASSSKKVKRVA